MKTLKIALPLICLALFAGITVAQVPGDGIPDVYLVTDDPNTAGPDETFLTSIGEITRPIGTMLVDTDGTDMVALIIGGPDVTTAPDDGNYLAGLTSNLPDPNNPPLFFSAWNIGYNPQNGSQWLRGSPDNTLGFAGVSGEHPDDPFDLFPNVGLTLHDGLFDDFGNITYSQDDGTIFSTDPAAGEMPMGFVTPTFIIPEPGTMSLFAMALLGLFGLRRRS